MPFPTLPYPPSSYTRGAEFARLLTERILVLDGAMGTMIQRHKLDEAAFRGERFAGHGKDLKGDNELLCLTRPDVVLEIHRAYLAAGADVIETNTFGATSIAQADYDLPGLAYELNVAAAKLARQACDEFSTPERPRFVAGALGPQPKTASISPDVNDPAARNVTFDELRAAYAEQLNGLLDGGIDLVLIETIFDTLNAKAAIFAVEEVFEARGERLPVMISGTVTDASGRILSGQTVEAFWNSVRHARPITIGLNCALGAALMRPYIAELSKICDTFVCVYPNAGLPNPLSETGFDETPEDTSRLLEEFARAGFVNVVGGCCGTTPDHIRAIAEKVANLPVVLIESDRDQQDGDRRPAQPLAPIRQRRIEERDGDELGVPALRDDRSLQGRQDAVLEHRQQTVRVELPRLKQDKRQEQDRDERNDDLRAPRDHLEAAPHGVRGDDQHAAHDHRGRRLHQERARHEFPVLPQQASASVPIEKDKEHADDFARRLPDKALAVFDRRVVREPLVKRPCREQSGESGHQRPERRQPHVPSRMPFRHRGHQQQGGRHDRRMQQKRHLDRCDFSVVRHGAHLCSPPVSGPGR